MGHIDNQQCDVDYFNWKPHSQDSAWASVCLDPASPSGRRCSRYHGDNGEENTKRSASAIWHQQCWETTNINHPEWEIPHPKRSTHHHRTRRQRQPICYRWLADKEPVCPSRTAVSLLMDGMCWPPGWLYMREDDTSGTRVQRGQLWEVCQWKTLWIPINVPCCAPLLWMSYTGKAGAFSFPPLDLDLLTNHEKCLEEFNFRGPRCICSGGTYVLKPLQNCFVMFLQ